LTITGTNFPWKLETSEVQIIFNDSHSTNCLPQESTSNTLICLTSAFDVSVDAGQTVKMNVSINSLNVTNELSFSTMTTTKAGLELSPKSANPTLKTKINITLEPDFPYSLDKYDFSVNATNLTNPSYYR